MSEVLPFRAFPGNPTSPHDLPAIIDTIPCIFCVFFLFLYKLNETKMQEIEEDLIQRRVNLNDNAITPQKK